MGAGATRVRHRGAAGGGPRGLIEGCRSGASRAESRSRDGVPIERDSCIGSGPARPDCGDLFRADSHRSGVGAIVEASVVIALEAARRDDPRSDRPHPPIASALRKDPAAR
ncbi:hypothetical protein GCM10009750_01820 [Agromyces salentinus]|uniref:Uncharacterized protein n=1 Tax=Agromyces salentinus TaxID=269421 RepID=A0ABN2MF99_9MICO